MATIFVNGCFDILHEGHITFLRCARLLGFPQALYTKNHNRLIVAVNSDASARALKAAKWGEKYPINNLRTRLDALDHYADEVWGFDNEDELLQLIKDFSPCILVKGPDYAGKRVTGDDLAPVMILDTPEPESVKEMKIRLYGVAPAGCDTQGKS